MTKMYLSATLGMLDWLETATSGPLEKCTKAAIGPLWVYAGGLCFGVPLFADFYCCTKTATAKQKDSRHAAFSAIHDAELGSKRRSYAAKLSPDNKVRHFSGACT